MARNGTDDAPFTWGAKQTQAAVFVAEDEITDEEIAKRVKTSRRTLARWKTAPEFRERVDELRADLEASALRVPIAKRYRRMAAINDRWKRMDAVIAARAEAMDGEAPGAETGLLVKTVIERSTKDGVSVSVTYAIDAPLLREMREIEKHAAVETGQYAERREITGRDGKPIAIEEGLSDEERAARLLAAIGFGATELAAGGGPSSGDGDAGEDAGSGEAAGG
jgi:hypothetical protein